MVAPVFNVGTCLGGGCFAKYNNKIKSANKISKFNKRLLKPSLMEHSLKDLLSGKDNLTRMYILEFGKKQTNIISTCFLSVIFFRFLM